MCGRYALYGPTSRLREQFGAIIDALPPDFGPRYNVAPIQMLPVVRQRPDGKRVVHLLRWGLIPSWSKDESIATRLINARGETLAEKPSFRSAYKARRCRPTASGSRQAPRLTIRTSCIFPTATHSSRRRHLSFQMPPDFPEPKALHGLLRLL